MEKDFSDKIKLCKLCGDEFKPKKRAYKQIYCSKRCCKTAFWLTPKGQAMEKRNRLRTKIKYNTDKEYKRRWRERCHKYATSNQGRKKKEEYQKEYRKSEKGKLSDSKYRKSNKRKKALKRYTHSEKGKSNGLRAFLKRKERLDGIIHTFTQEEWLQKAKNTFGVCPRCDIYVGIRKITLDHIIPISKAEKGQIYAIDDVQPLCLSCNTSKNNRIEA